MKKKTVKHLNIAIDGPSGSGKSTLAKGLASKLGLVYIDTGALYRTVGLFVQRKGLESTDTEGIIAGLPKCDISMKLENGGSVVYLNGEKMGDEIRTPRSSIYASDVSKIPEVREHVLSLQRDIAGNNDCIMDGRDIGTVILPDADVKIFLFASDEARAIRRYEELLSKGQAVTLEEVKNDMAWRDANDKNRDIAPAVPAPDAIMFDNSGLDREQTAEKAVEIIREKLKK